MQLSYSLKVNIVILISAFSVYTFADIQNKSTNAITINISPRLNPTGDLWATACISLSYAKKYKSSTYFGVHTNLNAHTFIGTFDYVLRSNNMDGKSLSGELRAGIGVGRYHYWVYDTNYKFFPVFSSSLNLEIGRRKIHARVGLAIDSDFNVKKLNSLFAFGPTAGIAVLF